jgi:hypothetical protein
MAGDWLVRTNLPTWLRTLDLAEEAAQLESLSEIKSHPDLVQLVVPLADIMNAARVKQQFFYDRLQEAYRTCGETYDPPLRGTHVAIATGSIAANVSANVGARDSLWTFAASIVAKNMTYVIRDDLDAIADALYSSAVDLVKRMSAIRD